jgi:hypothetical protein
MRKRTFFLLLFIVSASLVSVKAQVQPVDTGGSKVIIIENDNNTASNRPGHKKSTPSYNNLIRWNMFELAKGVIGFGYERRISDVFSTDIVLGYTTRDYIGNLFDEARDNNSLNYSSGSLNYTNSEYKISGGAAFMLGVRIYPGGNDDFDGFYIAPHLYMKNYNYSRSVDYSKWNGDYINPITFTETVMMPLSEKVTDLGVRFGWQRETGADGFFYDFNIGFGSRKTSYDQITAEERAVNGYNYATGLTTVSQEDTQLAILLGFNIGFAF